MKQHHDFVSVQIWGLLRGMFFLRKQCHGTTASGLNAVNHLYVCVFMGYYHVRTYVAIDCNILNIYCINSVHIPFPATLCRAGSAMWFDDRKRLVLTWNYWPTVYDLHLCIWTWSAKKTNGPHGHEGGQWGWQIPLKNMGIHGVWRFFRQTIFRQNHIWKQPWFLSTKGL